MNVDLRVSPRIHWNDNRCGYLKSCAPFVENKFAVLIHRPLEVVYRKAHLDGHIYVCVDYMCGNSARGENKFTFYDKAPKWRIVCARCEVAALEKGLPSSSELTGRHICVGGVKAMSHCHPEYTMDNSF